MSLRNWIDRSPGVKRLLEPSEHGREGVSVEPPAMPRHVYTLDDGAGETIRVDGAYAVRWSPGTTLLGSALTMPSPETPDGCRSRKSLVPTTGNGAHHAERVGPHP